MALTVGTLTAYIELDDRALTQTAARAERTIGQLAQQVTATTERAGEQAGQNLAAGVQAGAQQAATRAGATLAEVAQAAARAGQTGGEALGQGLADGTQAGAQQAGRAADAGLAAVAQAAAAAGAAAGQRLDTELTAGAREAGEDAGQALDRTLGDAAEDAGQDAGEQAGEGLQDGLSAADAGLAAVALALGATFIAGFASALENDAASGLLQAQLGTTDEVAAQHGKIAGDLYGTALVESVADAADVIRGIAQQGLLPPNATNAQIHDMGKRVATAAAVMGEDVSKVSRAVGTMLKSGIAQSADEAIDILVAGTQRGANAAEDLLDTFAEYPTQFRDLGLSAEEAMGLLQQGLQGGARDADTVADGLKEFAIRAKDMSTTSVEGFEAIGLSAREMAAIFAKGGPAARDALQTVIAGLNAMEDPVARNTAGVNLFGTKFEDMQQAFYSLDPDSAVAALGQVEGATDLATRALSETASARIERFKRSVEHGVTEVIGNSVIPALMDMATFAKNLWEGMPEEGQAAIKVLTVAGLVIGAVTLTFSLASRAAAGFRTWLAAVQTQATATSMAMRGLQLSMGIIGVALVAATTVMSLFGSASRDAKMESSGFARSLEQDAGRIGKATREQARAALEAQGLGEAAQKAGIGMDRMVDAVLGVGGASEEVNAKFKAYTDTIEGNAGAMSRGELQQKYFEKALSDAQGTMESGREEYERTQQVQEAYTETTDDATSAVEDQEKALDELGKAFDALRGQFLDARAAQAEVEAAVDEFTDSVRENGRTLDLNTEKGRTNDAALRDLVDSAYSLSEATLRQTGSTEQANSVLLQQRERFAQVLTQMGYTRAEVDRLTQQYFLIPENVGTMVSVDAGKAFGVLGGLAASLSALPSTKKITLDVSVSQAMNKAFSRFDFADGGIIKSYADGAHEAQIARPGTIRVWNEYEAGGEAYVPLATSKRGRSTAILRQVAQQFGYQLLPARAQSGARPVDSGGGGGSSSAGSTWTAAGARGGGLNITNYYESDSGGARETAAELDWLARNG
ncbi:phage tail tape measure protein [Yinghuangia soli]|uniref:Phage tail tape measure protein n=1 Tax=Yinghuangia soli TaxID=2908204 RepID=A0AA41Q555_9ACTN|nr:phage tail tape measure protein [Yinghuangia soli]MCF2531753.1 phage tail tape measure protein [Yinghuangia soli]